MDPTTPTTPSAAHDRVSKRIQERFNYIEDLPAGEALIGSLKKLTALMQQTLAMIPPDKAEAVMSDLHTFLEESAKPEPRREWWQLAKRGLLEAASTYSTPQALIARTIDEIGENLGTKVAV
jgi:hypothetical protein